MTDIVLVSSPISLPELKSIASRRFGDMVKAVVDVELKIVAVGGELHADEEAFLLDHGSKQQDLWGINIYVDKARDEWIEFDSVINIRPSRGNRSRFVDDEAVRSKIIEIVNSLMK